MESSSGVLRQLAVALSTAVFASIGAFAWYAVNAMGKLSSALSPNLGFDSSGNSEFIAEVTTPSPLIPAAIVAAIITMLSLLAITLMSENRLRRVAPVSVAVGPFMIWLFVVGTYAANRLIGTPSAEWVVVWNQAELFAMSVVLLVPWSIAAVFLNRRRG